MRFAAFVACLCAILTAPLPAAAQTWPAKPIRWVVPFPPGGSADLVSRTVTPKLAELLGQQVIIDYRGGAGGSIGAAEVARATPDGYTILIVWDTHAVNHHVYKVQYDFARSLDPISLLVTSPGILVAHPAFPPNNIKELIAYAKANPDKVTYGSAGAGSSNHLSGLLFSQLAGVKMTHVAYKGGGPLITDLLGGHINMVFGTLPLYEPHVRSGKMKLLTVMSKTRIPQFPDMAPANEAVPGFEAKTWFGLLAPAGLPKEILGRLNAETVRALNDPKIKETMTSRGFDVAAGTPEAFAAFLRQESEQSGRLARESGIKPE